MIEKISSSSLGGYALLPTALKNSFFLEIIMAKLAYERCPFGNPNQMLIFCKEIIFPTISTSVSFSFNQKKKKKKNQFLCAVLGWTKIIDS